MGGEGGASESEPPSASESLELWPLLTPPVTATASSATSRSAAKENARVRIAEATMLGGADAEDSDSEPATCDVRKASCTSKAEKRLAATSCGIEARLVSWWDVEAASDKRPEKAAV